MIRHPAAVHDQNLGCCGLGSATRRQPKKQRPPVNRSTFVLAACASLAVTACSAPTPTLTPANTPSATVAQTSAAPSSAAPSSESPSATPTSTEAPFAGLVDKKGDGGDADLVDVRMQVDPDGLTVLWTLTDDAPTDRTFLTYLTVNSADGEISRQLGLKWVDGETPGPFMFDFTTTQQSNYEDAPVIDENKKIATTFPSEVLEGLGDTWEWKAGTSVDGEDQDFTPEEGKKATFPSN